MSKPTLTHLPEICSTEATTAIDLYHEANSTAVLCWVFVSERKRPGENIFLLGSPRCISYGNFQYSGDLPRIELFRKPSETWGGFPKASCQRPSFRPRASARKLRKTLVKRLCVERVRGCGADGIPDKELRPVARSSRPRPSGRLSEAT